MARAPSTPRVILTHAAIVLITAVTIYPVLWVVRMALSPSQQFGADPTLLSGGWTLQNFVDVIGTSDGTVWLFGIQLLNSLIVAAATAGVGLALSTTAA